MKLPFKLSMDGTMERTELTDEICNGHVSADWDGHASRSFYSCMGCAGMWPWKAKMGPDTAHRKVVLKAEYRLQRSE